MRKEDLDGRPRPLPPPQKVLFTKLLSKVSDIGMDRKTCPNSEANGSEGGQSEKKTPCHGVG